MDIEFKQVAKREILWRLLLSLWGNFAAEISVICVGCHQITEGISSAPFFTAWYLTSRTSLGLETFKLNCLLFICKDSLRILIETIWRHVLDIVCFQNVMVNFPFWVTKICFCDIEEICCWIYHYHSLFIYFVNSKRGVLSLICSSWSLDWVKSNWFDLCHISISVYWSSQIEFLWMRVTKYSKSQDVLIPFLKSLESRPKVSQAIRNQHVCK